MTDDLSGLAREVAEEIARKSGQMADVCNACGKDIDQSPPSLPGCVGETSGTTRKPSPALVAELEPILVAFAERVRAEGPELVYTSNHEAGDGQHNCVRCGEERDEPHSWRECAERLSGLRTHAVDTGIDLQVKLQAAEAEVARLKTEVERAGKSFDRIGADRLADEVAVLVRRGVIDARSPAGDALLDYREPPSTERADRLAALEAQLSEARAELEEVRKLLDAPPYEACICRGCPRRAPVAWASGMCEVCIAEDCDHTDGAIGTAQELAEAQQRVERLEHAILDLSHGGKGTCWCSFERSRATIHAKVCDGARAALSPKDPASGVTPGQRQNQVGKCGDSADYSTSQPEQPQNQRDPDVIEGERD